jgi:hypothetical protein
VLCLAATALACASAAPGSNLAFRNKSAVVAIPKVSRPGYLQPTVDSVFRTRLVRVSGDPVSPATPVPTVWGSDVRHKYSRLQPWNATGKLLSIENRYGGATKSPLLLDGETYKPVSTPCDSFDNWDYRWHPDPAHANEQIAVNKAGTELQWFDVVRCVKTRSWPLPIRSDYGIGRGEGNASADGRFVVIANDEQMVVVDMDPKAPNAPAYPFQRIGPVYTFPPCSLEVGRPTFCPPGNISISPSGKYIDVKFGSGGVDCDTLCDLHRIYEVDSALVIRPHNMSDAALRCGSFANRPNGWVFPLKHADLATDPFDGNEDVLIGGRACPGSRLGRVVKVRLRDGQVTELTDGANEAGFSHASARNTARPGWVYVTYATGAAQAGRRFAGEIVAVKMDGSGEVERFGHYHSTQKPYRAEAHGVPSPDGKRVMFASDWLDACGPACGTPGMYGCYVFDARDVMGTAKTPRGKRR